MPRSVITPEDRAGDPAVDWVATVTTAADGWSSALEAVGCPRAYTVGLGGHRIYLVAPADWTLVDTAAMTWEDGTISVNDRLYGTQTLVGTLRHELGHGIGLGHADPAFGPSIMLRTTDGQIYPRDVAAAACILGCGPCDPTADPFDLN